eukprot:3059851-Rhodomonas_salina.2
MSNGDHGLGHSSAQAQAEEHEASPAPGHWFSEAPQLDRVGGGFGLAGGGGHSGWLFQVDSQAQARDHWLTLTRSHGPGHGLGHGLRGSRSGAAPPMVYRDPRAADAHESLQQREAWAKMHALAY